jgi:hypothetical protein
MKKAAFIGVLLSALLFQGCTNTFMGSVFIFNFSDIVLYISMAFVFAFLIALISTSEKRRSNFWLWFVLSLILTPLAGFIYFLIKLSSKK